MLKKTVNKRVKADALKARASYPNRYAAMKMSLWFACMIRKYFLHNKAWVIFISMFVIFVIIGLVSVPDSIPIKVKKFFFSFFFVFPILWLYVLGTNLALKLPAKHTMKSKLFRLLSVATIISFYLWQYFNVGHLFSVIFMNATFVYLVYFVSRSLVSAEREQLVGFYDYIGIFYLVWLLPVGVWWLQPRIIKIFNEDFA